MRKIAIYTGTRNIYTSMMTAAKSLMMHSDVDTIYFLIEDNEFPYSLPDCIKCINIRNQRFFRPDGPNMRSDFTYMSMIRVAYGKLLPNVDRILQMDADTIVVDDISDIWNLPIDDYYFSAVTEPGWTKEYGYNYHNVGVCLFNLRKLREDGIIDEAIDRLNAKYYRFIDQDVLAELCRGHVLEMDGIYNGTIKNHCTIFPENPKVIHYCGIKEWTEEPEFLEYEQKSWDEVLQAYNKRVKKTTPKYVIHTYPGRLWYVEDYLVPSMVEQGISKEDIAIYNDKDRKGNLCSCMDCFSKMPDDDFGAWHLQDDVMISSRFRELTEKFDEGIVSGFCNVEFDGKTVGFSGLVPVEYGWFSFQCVRIPNRYARGCAEWFYNDVVPNDLYHEYTKDGKCDDSIWQFYAYSHLQTELVYNLAPNVVDHIDYLIGGTVINKQRIGARRAYYFEDGYLVDVLERKLSERNK